MLVKKLSIMFYKKLLIPIILTSFFAVVILNLSLIRTDIASLLNLSSVYFARVFTFLYLVALFCIASFKKGFVNKVQTIYESAIIFFISVAYIITINRQAIFQTVIGNTVFVVDTAIIATPALIVIFFITNYNLFNKNKTKHILIFLQNLLICIHFFSFVNWLNLDRTNTRDFSNQLLYTIFRFNITIWSILYSLALATLNTLRLNLKYTKSFMFFFFVIFYFTLSSFLLMNNVRFISLTYWHQAITLGIALDFVYRQLYMSANPIEDGNFKFRAIFSASYHFLVIILFIVISLI